MERKRYLDRIDLMDICLRAAADAVEMAQAERDLVAVQELIDRAQEFLLYAESEARLAARRAERIAKDEHAKARS